MQNTSIVYMVIINNTLITSPLIVFIQVSLYIKKVIKLKNI